MTPETLRLLNPAFLATVIGHAAVGYSEHRGQGLPFALAFIVPPLVLHKDTRVVLPKMITSKLPDWAHKNSAELAFLPDHARELQAAVRSAIVIGAHFDIIAFDDEDALCIKVETHNHPSAIEPYQGAATGVGGILRDIFTMGARPIALMDPLRFGPLDDPRSRWIAEGVVSGVSGYGNAVGVPTVGGEVVFDRTYKGNPLVNVLCLGVLPTERLVLGRASGVGNLAVLLGSSTGRDGIGGVSVLASAGFSEYDDGE